MNNVIVSQLSGIIYVTQNLVNGKIYVGIHTRGQKDYLGSGIILNRAIKKYGRENFRRIDVDEFDSLEVGLAKERFWIQEMNSRDPNGYNLNAGGEGQFNPCQDVRTRLGAKKKGVPLTKAHKEKLSVAHLGKPFSEEHKAKLKLARRGKPSPMKGKHLSEESKLKMSIAKKGKPVKPLSADSIAKMRTTKKGQTWSLARRQAEERRKIR